MRDYRSPTLLNMGSPYHLLMNVNPDPPHTTLDQKEAMGKGGGATV